MQELVCQLSLLRAPGGFTQRRAASWKERVAQGAIMNKNNPPGLQAMVRGESAHSCALALHQSWKDTKCKAKDARVWDQVFTGRKFVPVSS